MRYRLNEPHVGKLEEDVVLKVLRSGWLGAKGEYTVQFEKDLALRHGLRDGLAVQSGTAALHTAVWACLEQRRRRGLLTAGDYPRVVVPDFTCAATAAAVSQAGATPILLDVEPDTIGLSFEKLEQEVRRTGHVEGVVLVHMYGAPARDSRKIADFCAEEGLFLVEDCAEAHGTTFPDGTPVGGLGQVAAFSMRSEKVIGVGDGGIACTSDRELIQLMDYFANRGKPRSGWLWKFFTDEIGFNYSMPHLLGAVAWAQLTRLDEFLAKRRLIARHYRERLPWLKWAPYTAGSSYWLNFVTFPVDLLADGKGARYLIEEGMHPLVRKTGELLMERGVEVRPGFYPLHRQPAFDHAWRTGEELWESDKLTLGGLCLPSHPGLELPDIDAICVEVESAWNDANAS